MKNFSGLIRRLHVYFGLFITPFILIFCISVLAFNHPRLLNLVSPVISLAGQKIKLNNIPRDTTDLLTAGAIIRKLGITGEIDYIVNSGEQISFPVNKPGLKTRVAVNLNTDSVDISSRREGSVRAMSYLHSMPGPHNAGIRGNSLFLKIWRIIADLVAYLSLFLLLSGIFLWYIHDFERIAGWVTLVIGVLFFTGLLYLIL